MASLGPGGLTSDCKAPSLLSHPVVKAAAVGAAISLTGALAGRYIEWRGIRLPDPLGGADVIRNVEGIIYNSVSVRLKSIIQAFYPAPESSSRVRALHSMIVAPLVEEPLFRTLVQTGAITVLLAAAKATGSSNPKVATALKIAAIAMTSLVFTHAHGEIDPSSPRYLAIYVASIGYGLSQALAGGGDKLAAAALLKSVPLTIQALKSVGQGTAAAIIAHSVNNIVLGMLGS